MAMIVYDCPRCDAKEITFDVLSGLATDRTYGWKLHYDVFCRCRRCFKGSVLNISLKDIEFENTFQNIEKLINNTAALDAAFEVDGFLCIKDFSSASPPEYLPPDVDAAFKEGSSCLAIACYNASGAMFRLAIDLATKGLLPQGDGTSGGPNRQQRKQLHERLVYLFDNKILPDDLKALADCVKDDGNDGAHDGTLSKADAEDLFDFAFELFERMFTEPVKLQLAKERREKRRQ